MDQEENKDKTVAKRMQRARLPQVDMGRIPPQALDAEEAVLGAMMLDGKAVNDAIDILRTPDAFYDPKHKVIFGSIHDLFRDSQVIDLLTVTERLRKNGDLESAGGVYYLSSLTNKVASAAHIEF